MSAGTNRIITSLIVVSVLLTSTPAFAGQIIYVDAKRHFRFQYPKRWKLTSGNVCWHHYFDGFLSLNNFDKEDFWLSNIDAPLGGQDAPLLTELPPGAAYIDMSWFGFPPLGYADDNVLRVLGEMKAQEIAGALERSTEKILENGQIRFRYISFIKWRREWCIRVYLREPVSEANRAAIDRTLASLRFDAFPVGDELWAAHLAREHLPLQADPNLFPLRGSWGYRSVRTIKEGSDIIVTFVEENQQWEPQRLWEFRVSDAGDVVPVPGKAPVNLQTSQWGAQASGLQCRVNAPTDIEQGMPLNTTVNLRCLPENVEPGVEQLNTFLYDEFLKLRLKNVKTQRVLTVRPYSYSYIGGPPRVDTGQNTSPLDGRPLGPWEVSLPLVRERDALEPGLYECTVEYSFPKEKTKWWHWTKNWESFGFWHGTIISGSFQLKILEEIQKIKQLLVPKRLRYSQEERKVYYTKKDAVKIEVPIRNGCFIHTFVYNNTKGGYSCRGGVPVPDDINGIDNCVELAKNRKLSCTIKVVETSVPYRHLQPPGPGYPGYKILWEQTFTVSRPESNALGMWGNEKDENSGLWLLSKACLP